MMIDNPADPTGCTVILRAVSPWATLRPSCGVYLDAASSSSTWAVFRGSLLIDLFETNLPSIRTRTVTRLVHSVLPFQVRFPKSVSADSDVTVYSPVNLNSAIIRQFTILLPNEEVQAQSLIRLFTSIQYPFKLTSPTWGARSRNDFDFLETTEAEELLAGEDCLDNAGDANCEQEFKIAFEAWTPPICDFTGVYTLNFVVRCEPGAEANCPLPLNTNTGFKQSDASVTFSITTEHFCPLVLAEVDIHAALSSYQDGAHGIPKDDFIHDATAYFKATVSSNVATIVECSISTITASENLFYSAPNALVDGLNVQDFPRVGGVSPHPTESWFDIVLNSDLFPAPPDGHASSEIAVVLNVVFLNTEGRRITQQLGMTLSRNHPVILVDSPTSSHTVQASSAIQLASFSTSASTTSSLVYIIVGSCVAAVLALGVAVFIYRRRTSSKESVAVAMNGVASTATGSTAV
jgi:hypothetical protein